jgi:hypothetical protein
MCAPAGAARPSARRRRSRRARQSGFIEFGELREFLSLSIKDITDEKARPRQGGARTRRWRTRALALVWARADPALPGACRRRQGREDQLRGLPCVLCGVAARAPVSPAVRAGRGDVACPRRSSPRMTLSSGSASSRRSRFVARRVRARAGAADGCRRRRGWWSCSAFWI